MENGVFVRNVKRMIVYQIVKQMESQNLSKSRLASAMNTSRAAVDRLLDPDNKSVTLVTLENVAKVLNLELKVILR